MTEQQLATLLPEFVRTARSHAAGMEQVSYECPYCHRSESDPRGHQPDCPRLAFNEQVATHDDLVVALEEAAGHIDSLALRDAPVVLYTADLNALESRARSLRRIIAAVKGSEVTV